MQVSGLFNYPRGSFSPIIRLKIKSNVISKIVTLNCFGATFGYLAIKSILNHNLQTVQKGINIS